MALGAGEVTYSGDAIALSTDTGKGRFDKPQLEEAVLAGPGFARGISCLRHASKRAGFPSRP